MEVVQMLEYVKQLYCKMSKTYHFFCFAISEVDILLETKYVK